MTERKRWDGRTEVNGWLYMGTLLFPRPTGIVFRDRTTNTKYILSHNSAGAGALVLTTPVPTAWRGLPSEPTMESPIGLIRLYVNNGVLSKELAAARERELDDEPVYTLNHNETKVTYLVSAGNIAALSDNLTLTRLDLGTRNNP